MSTATVNHSKGSLTAMVQLLTDGTQRSSSNCCKHDEGISGLICHYRELNGSLLLVLLQPFYGSLDSVRDHPSELAPET